MKPAIVPPSRTPQLVAALDEVERVARDLSAGEVEALLGRGARLDGLLVARLASLAAAPSAPPAAQPLSGAVEGAQEPDRYLSVDEAAERLGKSAWWVRKHKDSLGIVRWPGGRYSFSERALGRRIARRTA